MLIERTWAMPSKHTFTIKPIAELLATHCPVGTVSCDPFCGLYSPALCKNDINSDVPADFHEDALTYLKHQPSHTYEVVLYDPPYSMTQARERYGVGFAGKQYWSQCKKEIARIIEPGGKAICFGWNSGGVGKTNGMTLESILLVSHGGNRNDTIVTIERKL